MYSALVKGKYWLDEGIPTYFPVFEIYLEKMINMKIMKQQTDQAAGIFLDGYGMNLKLKFMQSFIIMILKLILEIYYLIQIIARASTIGLQKYLI